MSIFSKVGIFWLLFLVMYCTVLVTIVLFACQFGLSIIFFFNDGKFFFFMDKGITYRINKRGCYRINIRCRGVVKKQTA